MDAWSPGMQRAHSYGSRPRGGRGRGPRSPSNGHAAPWYSDTVQQRARGRGRRGRGRKRALQIDPEPEGVMHPDLAWYQRLFGRCVDRELEEEQLQVEHRLKTWPLERLRREGYVLMGCRARTHGRLFDKRIVRFSPPDRLMPHHLFAQGDLVTITKTSPLDYIDAEGVVYEKRAFFVSVVFERIPLDLTKVEWRLDKGSNKVAYERMHKALKLMCRPEHLLPSWFRSCVVPSALVHLTDEQRSRVPGPSYISHASLMTDPYTGSVCSLESAARSMKTATDSNIITATLTNLQTPREGLVLNQSQCEAIANGLSSRFSLIQGPPGTGKTSTAVHLIKSWRMIHASKGPVLATAQSNIAVDQLLSGCLKLGLNAIRLGQPVKVTPEFHGKTLDALLQQHPRNKEVELLRNELQALSASRPFLSGRAIGLSHRDASLKRKRLEIITDAITKEVVSSPDVVCATCIGVGSDLLKTAEFACIVLDEATQCTEPEALVALLKATQDASVVLIGDHQQLPPTVLSQNADSQRILGMSLFQRFVAVQELMSQARGWNTTGMSSGLLSASFNKDSVSPWLSFVEPLLKNMHTSMLKEQYRMHPILSFWPSQRFYNGQLIDAVCSEDRKPPAGIQWPHFQEATGILPVPLLFVSSTSGYEKTVSSSQSKFNDAQAKIVVLLVSQLLKAGDVSQSDIGIISPYTAQVQTIKTLLSREGYSVVRRDDDNDRADFLEVKSVDGYQGREKDVIILSSVRSNPKGDVGFLDDYRRFNVSITRAKRGLIVIGDPETLKHEPLWNAWLDFIHQNNLQIEFKGP